MDTTTDAHDAIGQAIANVGAARALAETMTDDEREAFARNLDRDGFGGRATVVRDGGAR